MILNKKNNSHSILIDENVPLSFYFYLKYKGLDDVLCIPGSKDYLGLSDEEIKERLLQDRILVTSDKGFLKSFNGLKLAYKLRYKGEALILKEFRRSSLYDELKNNGKELKKYEQLLDNQFKNVKSYELMLYSLYNISNNDELIVNIGDFFKKVIERLSMA